MTPCTTWKFTGSPSSSDPVSLKPGNLYPTAASSAILNVRQALYGLPAIVRVPKTVVRLLSSLPVGQVTTGASFSSMRCTLIATCCDTGGVPVSRARMYSMTTGSVSKSSIELSRIVRLPRVGSAENGGTPWRSVSCLWRDTATSQRAGSPRGKAASVRVQKASTSKAKESPSVSYADAYSAIPGSWPAPMYRRKGVPIAACSPMVISITDALGCVKMGGSLMLISCTVKLAEKLLGVWPELPPASVAEYCTTKRLTAS
mmetsp:Transcript_16568/g.62697  ORF Transcript_16568/g.62697 Transcript_16568/m.62697 type:complete len:259 (-) Transcript_16568:3222-3998(-)